MKRLICRLLVIVFLFAPYVSADDARAATSVATNPFEGRLVKIASDSAVYFIGLDQKRHAFPNSKIYFSWYQDFKKVEVIDDFAMSMYPLGRNVQYRPGSRLVKISDVSEVYAIEPGGVLRNIPSEEVAIALYGTDWSKLVDDLDISFFFDYEIGGVLDIIDGKPVYPRGTAVQIDSERFIVDKTNSGDFWLRPATTQAWEHNGFARSDIRFLQPSWRELYDIGLPIVSVESGYACLACDPSWSQEPNYTYAVRTSESSRYHITLPTSWGISFLPVSTGSMVDLVSATESLVGDGARISVQRFERGEGDGLQGLAQDTADLALMQQGEVFANQPSASRIGAMDIVYARPSEDALGELVWTRLMESESGYYAITFTAPWSLFGRYREAAHQALQSFDVDERITE